MIMTQKKQTRVSKLELMRESLNQNVSSMYKGFVIFISVLFLLLIGFGILFKPIQIVSESRLNEFYASGNLKFSVIDKKLNEEQNQLVLTLNTDPKQFSVTNTLEIEVSSQLRGASSEDMKMTIYKGSAEYLEIVFQDIPEGWTAIRLAISESGNEPAVLMFNRTAVTDSYGLLTDDIVFNNNHAELRSIFFEIETLRRTRVDEKGAEGEKILVEIEELRTSIPDLEAEKKYQTEQQKNETDQQIRSIEQQIIMLENSYSQNQFEQNELLAREELLKTKYEELKNQYENSQ